MASKYLQQFPIPPEFPNILRDLTREILRLQPQDIIAFSAEYFKCKQAGKEFVWDEANPRAPRPCDYPKIIRKEPEKVKYSTKPGSEPKAASQVHQSHEAKPSSEQKEVSQVHQSHEAKPSSEPKVQEVTHEKKKSIGIESRNADIQEKKTESKSDEKHSRETHHQTISETREVITETRQVITETRHEIHIEHSEEHHQYHETHQTIEESKEHYDSSVIPSLASPSEAAAKEYVEGLVDRVEKRISVQP